ncbi:MAG: NnrU family protein [Pseudomonadota bacterium]
MILLLAGLALWWGAHLFKRVAPGPRARLGEPGKALAAVLILGSVVLMVLGYRQAAFIPVWSPPHWATHLNNLLMFAAFYTYGAGAAKGGKAWFGTKLRHPQQTGFGIWTVAHLLVNGHLAAIVLFGGLLAWAVAQARVINAQEGPWEAPPRGDLRTELRLVAVAVVLYGLVTSLHIWLGVWPFG